jgi:UDP-N-acetylmuramate dehydrogenase
MQLNNNKQSSKLIKNNVALAAFTTFKIGGKAKFFSKPRNINELIELLKFAKSENIPHFILGGGSNTLFADGTIEKLVISTGSLNRIIIKQDCLIAECGAAIEKLNKIALKQALSGLEFSAGLPGSLGGAVFMNARAYEGEMSQVVSEVEYLDEEFNIKSITNEQCNFSYKNSFFMQNPQHIILRVKLNLPKKNKYSIKQIYQKNLKDRRSKGQYRYPSAGCVFKNDYNLGIPCGKVIDSLGLKGLRIGDAQVYEEHANFIINKKKATARDVIKLIEIVEDELFYKKGIKFERELNIIT